MVCSLDSSDTPEPDDFRVWNPDGVKPNKHLSTTVAANVLVSSLYEKNMEEGYKDLESRSELDTHANMVVVGSECFIIRWTGRNAEVNAFSPELEALQAVPIVDAALLYECPVTGQEYLLVVRNALYVKSMRHNLIPPFIMREAGVRVNDVPKIHSKDPTIEHHSISFKDSDLRIPLSLWGIFSYFVTRAPTKTQMSECEEVYLLTPNGERWDPHTDVYAHNEESMTDWEGNIVEAQHRVKILLSEVPENEDINDAAVIGSVESNAIDRNCERISEMPWPEFAPEQSGIEVSPIYDQSMLLSKLSGKAEDGHFKMSVGATTPYESRYLVETTLSDDESPELELDDFDIEEFMSSATHARMTRDTDAQHLSTIWRIDLETAKRTLETTSQHCARTPGDDLSRNYSTNDRMLRYKRIKEYFFMDTFYATSKAGKSTRGHTCCQLFVTDKSFVYVVPMKREAEVLQAVKQFAKAIGAPEALIADAAKAQKSEALRHFCNEIGTSLRVLEEGTPWANKAELYIGLIKEAVRKDMKDSNCPLPLWDYCVERRARINNMTARDLFSLHGTTPHTALTGEEGDISNLCRYGWYEWCKFREQTAKFPFNKEVLGRVLGPASGEGNEMAQWVLKCNGNVVPRRTLRPLSVDELHSPTEIKSREIFDTLIQARC